MNKINFDKPFALIKRQEDKQLLFLQGELLELDKLDDIPKNKSKKNSFDTLSFIPFSQIKERGFKTHDDGAKILCLKIKQQKEINLSELIKTLPNEKIEFDNDIKYDTTEKEYKKIIKNIIDKEIGNGEGANFVISRKGEAQIKNMNCEKALTIFKNLLKNEIGSYWIFIFYDGSRYFIGATPERHVSVKNKEVMMNPISGTFRKNSSLKNYEKSFTKFLSDQKEINELFMVVDEELKMMARFCNQGGEIKGPLLKEMSKLIHTEYLLKGKSNNNIIHILRESMYAATVTGSPTESACKIIYKYEPIARRYYASALALIGHDKNRQETLDSPIAIRTIEIDNKGKLITRVGATLVRDSDPEYELEETKAKLSAMLDNIINPPKTKTKPILIQIKKHKNINDLLKKRNKNLSKFWFFNQESKNLSVGKLKSKKITILDNEDDFCHMLKHIIVRMGVSVNIVKFYNYNFAKDNSDLIIIGPGTGNPNNKQNKKMIILANIIKKLLSSNKKFLAICLGHQLLCKSLNIKVVKKENPFQGVQKEINFFGKQEKVGFYNTFTGVYQKKIKDLEISYNKKTKEIYALKNDNFISMQFHPESILTQHGYKILEQILEKNV